MSVYMRTATMRRLRAAVSIDFTEALLMVGLVIGSKALGLW